MGTPPATPTGPRFSNSLDSGRPPAETAPADRPVIDSSEAAGKALGELFLFNADRGDDAANDHLVTELVRRIRAQQTL